MPAAAIRIEQFGGARPRSDSRALNDIEAQVAENCRLWSGKLSAWRKPNRIFGVGHNYLRWSNQFQQSLTWAQAGLIDVVPNATLAPDGTLTADKLREDNTSATHRVQQAIAKDAVSEYWTAAVSGKPAERQFLWLRMESVIDFVQVIINTSTGAIVSQSASGAFTDRSVKVDAEANGFYRVHLTAKTPATAGISFYVGMSSDGTLLSYLGTTNSGLYVDGASLRKSNKPGPYRETLQNALPADPTSIYGFRDQYWFVANEVRHFARAPIASDTVETTYFTRPSGDPRVTYSPIAEDSTGSGDLPRNSFSAGLPVPGNPPQIVLQVVSGSIAGATSLIGTVGGPIATASYNLGPFAVDGNSLKVKVHLKASLATLNCAKATAIFQLTRTGFSGILARLEVPVDFTLAPIIGDTQVVEQTIEVEDLAPAGSRTWVASVTIQPYSGSVTPTYVHNGGSVRYKSTTLTSGGHQRVVGDLVAIQNVLGMEAINTSRAQITAVPTGNTFTIDIDNLGQTYTSGGAWTLVVDDEDISDIAYVYTWLSTIGGKVLEGPPSAPSNTIARGDGQTVNVSTIDVVAPADGGSYNFSGKRIYRTNVRSDLGANYQFVAEISVGQNNFVDTIRDIALGEVMPSTTWIKPPNDMHGLIEHTNGVLAGISGKEVCFCEPYQPHAWPVKYRLASFSPIVALIGFGASIGVLTRGKPHVINGTVPGSMEMTHLEAAQPCMSALGTVDMGYAGVYPGDDGLVSFSPGGMELVTREIFTREDWQKLNPSSMRAAEFDDRYVCSFTRTDGTQGSFVLDPKDPLATYTTLSIAFSALWTDPENGTLYVLFDEYICVYDAAPDWLDYRWRSKTFDLASPTNFAYGKVESSDYPVNLDIYSNPDPALIEENDGAPQLSLMDSITVTDAKPFPLNGDYSGSLYEFEVRGNGAGELKTLAVATSIERLRRA